MYQALLWRTFINLHEQQSKLTHSSKYCLETGKVRSRTIADYNTTTVRNLSCTTWRRDPVAPTWHPVPLRSPRRVITLHSILIAFSVKNGCRSKFYQRTSSTKWPTKGRAKEFVRAEFPDNLRYEVSPIFRNKAPCTNSYVLHGVISHMLTIFIITAQTTSNPTPSDKPVCV
jgi:hypothetical protein